MVKDLKNMLLESIHVPTMPAVATQLLSISDWERADLNKIADTIRNDVSLSSRILRVANSPFYGFSHAISTVSRAVVALGLRATRTLCLSFSLMNMINDGRKSSFDYQKFWTRSLNTAVTARELALIVGLRTEEEAFLSGLLQDIGIVAIGQCIPDIYNPILARADGGKTSLVDLEREHLCTDHVEIAKLIFDEWNLPASLCIPVLYHHAPEKARTADDQTLLSIQIQHIAGCIGNWLYTSEMESKLLIELANASQRYFHISPKEFEALLYRVDLRMEEISQLFELNNTRPNTYANLLQSANLALGKIVDEQERLLHELEAAKTEAQRLTKQLRVANEKLLKEARMDSLTDLANRRRFEEFLEQELKRSLRYNRPVSLLFIDLDNLKSVNDHYGHLEGGNILRQFAEILRCKVRASDMVARYGGDEFVIALVETDGADALVTAERIRQSVEESGFYLCEADKNMHLTACIGVTTWNPQEMPIEPDDLIREADAAMYRAKQAGKNRVVFFEDIHVEDIDVGAG